jgi:uncharacterized protein YciI
MLPTARPAVRCLLFALVLLSPAGGAGAAAPAPEEAPPGAGEGTTFLITLRPAQPETVAGEAEKARITAHFDYLKGLKDQGTLVLAGLTADSYSELLIIRARDAADAERIMVADPAVRGNVLRAELHPFRIVLAASGR